MTIISLFDHFILRVIKSAGIECVGAGFTVPEPEKPSQTVPRRLQCFYRFVLNIIVLL